MKYAGSRGLRGPILLGAAVAVLAGCADAHEGPTAPGGPDAAAEGPSTAITTVGYTAVVGDDWKAYATKDQLKAADLFWWFRTGDVYQYVDLVPDPTFGQVVRITFPQSTEGDWVPKMNASFTPRDKVWYRWRMKFSPGWTTVGTLPAGYANSYKIAFQLWEGYEGRAEVEYSNTDEYMPFWNVKQPSGAFLQYSERVLPGSASSFGRTGSEWTDGEYYEFVMYYEKTGPTSARQHWWRRRLTNNGAIVNTYPWTYLGREFTGSTTPRVRGITLGGNKNRNNTSTSYIYWGPWEVVDGSQYPNPWNMPNVSGTAPTPPTLTGVALTPDSATLAPGGTQQFTAGGRYSDGSTGAVTVTYSATGGTITTAGAYTAPAAAGTYLVVARESSRGLADTSRVTVSTQAATLTGVSVTPPTASVQAGGTVQFAAAGQYSDGSSRSVPVTWSATGGTITTAGLYTAGQTAGTYRVIAVAQGSTRADTSTVTVTSAAAALQQVLLTPATASAQAGGTVQFAAQGRYSDGSTRAVTVTWSATGGTISTSGVYTAGQTAGSYRVIAVAQGSTLADTSAVTVTAPAPGGSTYARLLGDDWRSYTSSSQLSAYYSSGDLANVSLVSDPLFGKVVRLTQRAGSTASPRLTRSLPAPASRAWYRWRVRFSPGWSTSGSAWTMSQWTWSGQNGAMGVGFTGGNHTLSFNVRDASWAYLRYSESQLAGSGGWGPVGSEFSDGQWYEYVMLWEKTGATTGRAHWWVRRLTSGGAVVNNAWTYNGISLSGATTPQVGGVSLGAGSLGRAPAANQHVDWGPWEVVDGTRHANPFGMPGF